MTVFLKTLALMVAFSFLQGCGNDGQKEFYTGLWDVAKTSVPSKSNDELAAQKKTQYAKVLETIDEPLIIASSGPKRTALIRVSSNAGYEQWHSPGKIGFTFKNGFLTATRGLGGDLMNADVEESIERIGSLSSQPATRIHRYLSGENTIILRSFVCILKHEGQEDTHVSGKTLRLLRVSEKCTNSDTVLNNTYWLDQKDGFIWKSNQWISTQVGAFTFERAFR